MDVVTSPTGLQTGVGAGHMLNLDGQGESDHYTVYTNGSHGSVRNYVINVLDTGAPDNGVDELAIFGYDSLATSSTACGRSTCIDNRRHLPAAGAECIDTRARSC